MYTQPKTSIPSCLLALLTLALPIHGATDDDGGDPTYDKIIDNNSNNNLQPLQTNKDNKDNKSSNSNYDDTSNAYSNGVTLSCNDDESKSDDNEDVYKPFSINENRILEQKRAFQCLLYTREITKHDESQDVSTFFVAKHFGDRHYWKIRNGQDIALGTNKKERESALKFWTCGHIAVSRLKTKAIRKRIGYDISSTVPVTYTDKDGNDKTKEKTEFYASAKQIMEYLTSFYAPTDNPAQRKWKRKFGGVTSYQYETLDEAIKAGIHPEDYITVYKAMKLYFAQPKMKLVYNDTSRPYMKGAVEKLMHPRFKHILEKNTHNNVGTDWTKRPNRSNKSHKAMVIKSLHEATVTAIQQDLSEQGKEMQNADKIKEILDAKHENEQIQNEEQGTPDNDNIVESIPFITSSSEETNMFLNTESNDSIQDTTYDFNDEPRQGPQFAFKRLVYMRKNKHHKNVSTFLVAKHAGEGNYSKKKGTDTMTLGTTRAEREAVHNIWQKIFINIDKIQTKTIYDIIRHDPERIVVEVIPKDGDENGGNDNNNNVSQKSKYMYYTTAKLMMSYLTGCYTLKTTILQSHFADVKSHQYKTLEAAIQAGINPKDYVLVYKAMTIYFKDPRMHMYYKTIPVLQTGMEKLLHPYFNNLVKWQNNNTPSLINIKADLSEANMAFAPGQEEILKSALEHRENERKIENQQNLDRGVIVSTAQSLQKNCNSRFLFCVVCVIVASFGPILYRTNM